MAKCMKANGPMGSKKARASGEAFLGTPTSALGKKVKQMATEYISGKMETDTRASGWTA
jgi:hypothetical protein